MMLNDGDVCPWCVGTCVHVMQLLSCSVHKADRYEIETFCAREGSYFTPETVYFLAVISEGKI